MMVEAVDLSILDNLSTPKDRTSHSPWTLAEIPLRCLVESKPKIVTVPFGKRISAKTKLTTLTTELVPWLQTSWRDSG